MVSAEELRIILTQLEGSGLEFKKSAHFIEPISHSICAFANSGGGLLILGVESTNGKNSVHGIENKDEAYQKLTRALQTLSIKPQIEYEEHKIDTALVIIVKVPALSPGELCFFGNRVYIRQGSINLEIKNKELVEFLKSRGIISFEEKRSTAKVSDLSEEKISRHLINRTGKKLVIGGPQVETLLQSLGIANAVGDFYIKNVGVLAFAKDIIKFFSNCEVRIVKYKGRIPTLETREYDMRLVDTVPELLEKAFGVVKEKAGISARLVDGKRVEMPMIPDKVLREALTNAVGHRDYFDPNGILVEIFDDRLQITNPGTLLPGQTINNFAELRRHRNPILHRILNDEGWGDGLNLGVRAIVSIMREEHMPDPKFEDLGGFFRITLYGPLSDKIVRSEGQITEAQRKAIKYLENHTSITAPYYADIAGVSHPTGIKYLNDLVRQGILKRVGNRRSSKYILDKVKANIN